MDILTAFGLSAGAGLNAYIPLLVVALLARFTDWLSLNPPYQALTSWVVIGLLVVLTAVEFFADKIPGVNHINDLIQTLIRPTAGAILFAASTSAVGNIHPVLAICAGILVAGGVHLTKSAAVRPAVSASTAGVGHPVVSFVEDVTAAVLSVISIVIPTLVGIFFLVLLLLIVRRLLRHPA